MSWKALLEIKCPHKYRNGLSGWDSDPGFHVSSDGCMDEGHPYYGQLQHQVLVTGFEKIIFTFGQIPKLITLY